MDVLLVTGTGSVMYVAIAVYLANTLLSPYVTHTVVSFHHSYIP